jgi:Transglutaminase elicitor
MSVGWWGSCDKVARAGILFEEPKKDVTLNGVTFTTQDIKGLLTVLADSQGGGSDFVGNRYDANPDTVALKNGQQVRGTLIGDVTFDTRGQQDWQISSGKLPDTVKLRLIDGTEKTFGKAELSYVAREDKRDDPVVMHETISEWLKSGRPAVMDRDSGEHVWNYNFYRADDTLYQNGLKPSWGSDELLKNGYRGPAGDGKIIWVEREVALGGGGGTQTYRYWLEEKNGKLVNGGWEPSSPSPDFLWRPQTEAAFTGRNERNPFVDPRLVKEIYEASIH